MNLSIVEGAVSRDKACVPLATLGDTPPHAGPTDLNMDTNSDSKFRIGSTNLEQGAGVCSLEVVCIQSFRSG